MSQQRRFQFRNLGITRGALIVFGLQLGVSLVWMMCDPAARAAIEEYAVASPSQVFEHGRVWTLATSPFLETDFLQLVLQGFMMFLFVPTLERFWGTARFYRFVAATSIVGVLAGIGLGQLMGVDFPILGLAPFTWAAVVAFGIVYARQPVQLWGVLPLTGRQMMYGLLGFLVLFVLLQQKWQEGAAYAGCDDRRRDDGLEAMEPGPRVEAVEDRARAREAVGHAGRGRSPSPKRDEQKWLN